MAFRENSDKLNKTLSKEIRKKQGIYFTPKKARDLLFETLKDFKPKNILEPSFGSGEFLDDMIEHYPKTKVVGLSVNVPRKVHQQWTRLAIREGRSLREQGGMLIAEALAARAAKVTT